MHRVPSAVAFFDRPLTAADLEAPLPDGLVAALCELAFRPETSGNDSMLALTSLKVLLTVRVAQWRLLPAPDRIRVAHLCSEALRRMGNVPVLLYLAAKLLYEERLFNLVDTSNIFLLKEVLRLVKNDIADCVVEKLTKDAFKERAGPCYQNWSSIVGAAAKVLSSAPVGGPLALACIKVFKLVLVDMNNFVALTPAVAGNANVGELLSGVAKQLFDESQKLDGRYVRAQLKLLRGALLGEKAAPWAPFLMPLLVNLSSSPRIMSDDQEVCRLIGEALDHPDLRDGFAASFLTPERTNHLLRVCSSLLSAPDNTLLERGADFVQELSNDLNDDDSGAAYLMLVLGRSKMRDHVASQLRGFLQNAHQMGVGSRAALYEMLAASVTMSTPFSMIMGALEMETRTWAQASNRRGPLWIVFRACCQLVESAALAIQSIEDYRKALNFLSFVLSEADMNVIPRVHACIALRCIVEWHRCPVEQARAILSGLNICQGVTNLFSKLYSQGPLDDDLTESTLLSILPLQVQQLEHVAKAARAPVGQELLKMFNFLWTLDTMPLLARVEILHSIVSVITELEEVDAAQHILPLIAPLLESAVNSSNLMSDAIVVLSTVALRSQPTDALRSQLIRFFAMNKEFLADINCSVGLMALLEVESKLAPSEDVFKLVKHFASEIQNVVGSDYEHAPYLATVVVLVRFHGLFKQRTGSLVLFPPWAYNYLQEYRSSGNDLIECIAILQQQ